MEQAIDRSGYHIRDIKSYFKARRKTTGARLAFALLEAGLDMPDEIMSHPAIEKMSLESIDMIGMAKVGQ